MVLSIKFLEDKFFTNTFYSKVGGIPLKELNNLERKFINLIDFEFFVTFEELSIYKQKILMFNN